MAEYTVGSLIACAAVFGAERFWFRTGLFRTKEFWIAEAIVLFFQCLMDGWLTKLSAPVVIYNEKFDTGWRFPWDIPVEDFLFGFALVALGLLIWMRSERETEA